MAIKKEQTQPANEGAKPGFKSTEFWLSLLATLLGFFMSSGLLPDTHWAIQVTGLAVAALSQLGYTHNRSKLKATEVSVKALKAPEPVLVKPGPLPRKA